jgi:RNA 2',3'-cyclic 3'-phosphodiesterase
MRLFIALELPDPVKTEMAAMQRRLQEGQAHPVKWVATDSAHLTLQFLGEVDKTRVDAILAALKPITQGGGDGAPTSSRLQLPTLSLAPVGAFPSPRRPQVLWLGLAGDLDLLKRLQQTVVAAMEPLGFVPEKRNFQPHLTLGRVRREATTPYQQAISDALQALPPPRALSWQCGPPILFQSTLRPSGAVYTKLST